ncbi:MAG: hypothetical protein A3I26_00180 [Candidatus Yanofskybacteria bacterium RIFCSPLOWO2_02_FULL_43_10]|uniref:VOC domain-containing protein n=1 Tax=Candidatus Yanofskybacteria bacterium RIFCSPLOWO2_12_FULL_43_11b TaxID=1802710 RepID=A0A1F8H6Q5_9BACT|nr:MAG: hypothetical protein A2742_01200 [Candidatus Yanofskybacteria bacterium RIFCSPHIGHO2_01_FULL_43_32]OGN11956.1 MAG: hypothetical protein A3C69_02735 [Candidatus Yanofskybacteria bacterium RIFCSPHIGHO2_02_FULL_43_12]OGN17299.1 MAG: hypothetical protein A3E34_00780 [Candidatus Yanofskybacteria bacterium RIFCSPHIGHO2_12_FULL_43_11]OGN24368.1 MAG: hypothetical protein A2923_00440 [Candidatus Yanofskybacteria bacterium RIFCSPLOWO2_01_FULL_43_46]OGN30956.1 MAG: hypothetical protein A3I26_00180
MTIDVAVSRITLFSVFMDKTAEFYNAIGLNLQKSRGEWSGEYHYLDILEHGGQRIFFEIHPLKSGLPVVSPHGLGFDVENVPEVLKKLMEMDTPVSRPGNPKMYFCCTLAETRDPDGRTVTITQHGKVKPA